MYIESAGEAYEDDAYDARMLKEAQENAAKGGADAQYKLDCLYDNGLSTPKD